MLFFSQGQENKRRGEMQKERNGADEAVDGYRSKSPRNGIISRT